MRVEKSRLSGALTLPPSKSHTMRALVLASLARGRSKITNPLPSPDTEQMIAALRLLGAHVEKREALEVVGGQKVQGGVIDAGNSGQVYRFAGALAALHADKFTLTGDTSIRNRRSIGPLLDGIEQLGGKTGSVWVHGPIKAGKAHLDGALSQPISALLMATATLPGTTELVVVDSKEEAWIDLTLYWLRKLGVEVTHSAYQHYRIHGRTLHPFETTIPADWSAAAFPIAAALITRSPLQIVGLDFSDVQGDKIVAEWFSGHIRGNLFIEPGPISGGSFDMNRCIDAVPIMAVLGCYAQAPFFLENAAAARKKESDRLHAITVELRKMGGKIVEHPDGLTVYPSELHGAHLDAHADHRIAMALAVAAMGCGGCVIEGTACIEKSFPHFITSFQRLGAEIS